MNRSTRLPRSILALLLLAACSNAPVVGAVDVGNDLTLDVPADAPPDTALDVVEDASLDAPPRDAGALVDGPEGLRISLCPYSHRRLEGAALDYDLEKETEGFWLDHPDAAFAAFC